jgi:hypothetical protein
MIRLILIFFLHVSVFVCAVSSRSVTLKTKVVLANDRLAFNVTITNKMGKDIYVRCIRKCGHEFEKYYIREL